jgi:hypothetical protein
MIIKVDVLMFTTREREIGEGVDFRVFSID